MKPLLYFLSNPLILIGLWALFIWLLIKSSLFAWLAKLAVLLGWGAMTVGATLFAIFAVYLPREEYGAAIGALFAGSLISSFWLIAGLPALIKTLRKAQGGIRLWKS